MPIRILILMTTVLKRILIPRMVMQIRLLVCMTLRKIFAGLIKVGFFRFEINVFQKSSLECWLFWAPDAEKKDMFHWWLYVRKDIMFSLDYYTAPYFECYFTISNEFKVCKSNTLHWTWDLKNLSLPSHNNWIYFINQIKNYGWINKVLSFLNNF